MVRCSPCIVIAWLSCSSVVPTLTKQYCASPMAINLHEIHGIVCIPLFLAQTCRCLTFSFIWRWDTALYIFYALYLVHSFDSSHFSLSNFSVEWNKNSGSTNFSCSLDRALVNEQKVTIIIAKWECQKINVCIRR